MPHLKPVRRDVRVAPRAKGSGSARVACLMGTLAMVAWFPSAAAQGQPASAEILSILADMVGQEYQFKPDRLHGMGVEGLSAVLDELLPDTAEPKKVDLPEDVIARLIDQLADENYRVRETASEKLYQLGPSIRAGLIEAARSADAEVSWRATRILRRWESRQKEDKGRYYAAFCVYAAGIQDDQRLEELLRRTLAATDAGTPGGSRSNILRQCMTTLARSGKQQYINPLKPLLKHDDVQVAVLVTQAVGSAVSANGCPSLFLDALQAGRPEIVASAIGYTLNGAESPRKTEIRRLLIDIFEGDDETQKVRATMPLMHAFEYPAARDYLLEQAKSNDRNRQYQALSYLGSSRQQGQAADAKLLDALTPLLKSTDNNVRRMAARALANYCGEEVVKSLIPLLADKYTIIPREVNQKLLEQPDKKMLRRLLTDAAKDDSNEKVKKAAAELLKKLGQPP